jgi:hypothetical protein
MALLFAMAGYGMWFQNRLDANPSFELRTPERPYPTTVKGKTVFVGRRDYWINTLWIYVFLAPLAGAGLVELYRERRARRHR